MGAYQVDFEPRAFREVRRLPQHHVGRIMDRIRGLATEPRPPGCEKLRGPDNSWRIRAGDYRVVYRVDDAARVVTIARVGHRRDVYREG